MSLPQPNQPRTNFLEDLIPATQRKRVYALYGLVGFLLGALALAYAAVSQELPPTWVIISVVIYNFASPFFSALATANAVPTGNEAIKKGGQA
jgi:hypothetical protein